MMVSNRILLVDDEVNLLQSFRRTFNGKFDLVLAEGGAAAVDQLAKHGPFAIVVSDMQMPDVNGLKVLAEAKRRAPDTVRIMLTGNVDQQTAVNAVNDGAIFRFINKPCPVEQLQRAFEDGLRQHQLLLAEKDVLSKTLAGCVGLINELLATANPSAYGRGGRIRQWMKQLCQKMKLADVWQYEIAAMLSQLGSMAHPALPDDTVSAPEPQAQEHRLRTQATTAASLLSHIPRLETIADMINCQYTPPGKDAAEAVFVGCELLRLLIDFDILLETRSTDQAIKWLKMHEASYDCYALMMLAEVANGRQDIRSLRVSELREGMLLEKDVLTGNGEILLSNGHELTTTMIERLRSFIRNSIGVREPIVVRVNSTSISRN